MFSNENDPDFQWYLQLSNTVLTEWGATEDDDL